MCALTMLMRRRPMPRAKVIARALRVWSTALMRTPGGVRWGCDLAIRRDVVLSGAGDRCRDCLWRRRPDHPALLLLRRRGVVRLPARLGVSGPFSRTLELGPGRANGPLDVRTGARQVALP